MVPNHQNEISSSEARLRSHLLWYRVIICILLFSAVASDYLWLRADELNPWVFFARPLFASLLLALAFIENARRLCPAPMNPRPLTDDTGKVRRKFWHYSPPPRAVLWFRHGYQLLLTALCALLAINIVGQNFPLQLVKAPDERELIPAGLALLLICFALLVGERMLSFRRIRHWPYQTVGIGLLRALLSICLLTLIALSVSSFALIPAGWIVEITGVIVLLIAAEFLLRMLAALFVAPREDKTPPFLSQSLLAEHYRWPLHPLLLIRKKIIQHFGVDIGKIQAFRLMGQILFPVLCGIALIGWLMSSINEVSLHQRGVYERFGRPVNVLLPGLHLGLPWPFGRVMPVDYGAIHELQLSEAQSAESPATQSAVSGPSTLPTVKSVDAIEGPAPQSSWRLWDNTHTTDQAQVIASAQGDKQSFQIVNMDIRLLWRVGMQDSDAINSLYQTDDLATTIQRIARQVLTQYFAHQQLDVLLNEQRATMAATINSDIQARLNQLHIGVELLSTRVESIHPPAGAANAYHGVQAAQITANALIARERGYAAVQSNDAHQKATTAIDSAQATANEVQAKADNTLTRYRAEHDAWAINPQAFMNERRYQTMSKALSRAPLLIIDSQVAGQHDPMLDLRPFSPSAQ
ncbi:protease modulator HflK [Klebsiella sp. I138]|uniref:protease modulator HflK n=1 Tax=Klebsiella sp. I138 TaxID=2755385 RepID=UPI003DA9D65D